MNETIDNFIILCYTGKYLVSSTTSIESRMREYNGSYMLFILFYSDIYNIN